MAKKPINKKQLKKEVFDIVLRHIQDVDYIDFNNTFEPEITKKTKFSVDIHGDNVSMKTVLKLVEIVNKKVCRTKAYRDLIKKFN